MVLSTFRTQSKLILGVLSTLFISVGANAAPHGMLRPKQLKGLDQILAQVQPDGQTSEKVLYYGGPVISNAKVTVVLWGDGVNATTTKQIADFYKAVLNSTYFDWLSEYNTNVTAVDGRQGTNQTIGRGSFAELVQITPSNASKKLQDADIQAELDAQITAGKLPAADDNSLYMIYFPPGVSISLDGQSSCQAFCAYHEGFKSKTHGNVFYGIMPDLGGACALGCRQQQNEFDDVTSISSHELIEAVTDPFPTPGNQPAYPQAWNDNQGNEVADICVTDMGTTENQLTAKSSSYVVQGIFDNTQAACTKGPWKTP